MGSKMVNRKYLTQNKSFMEKWQNKKDMKHIENKQQNGRCKSYLISNYIKRKRIKHSNQKVEKLAEWIKKNTQSNCILSPKDTLWIQRHEQIECKRMEKEILGPCIQKAKE